MLVNVLYNVPAGGDRVGRLCADPDTGRVTVGRGCLLFASYIILKYM